MSNKQQLLKDFVSQQIQNSKQQTQPIVNSDGFKNGEPPAGSNWRIPGDTLYNPTPYPIQAVSDNGITKTLNPFDESTVEFPGAKYVDEYQMRFGGLKKFLPGGFSIEPEPGPGPTPVKPDYSYMQTIYDKYATDYPMLKIGDLVPTRSSHAQSVDELKGHMMSTGTISLYGLEDLPPEIATKIVAEIDAENLKRNPNYTTQERGRGKTDMWTDPRLVKSYNKVFDNVYINADGQIAMPFKTRQPVFQDLPKPVEPEPAPVTVPVEPSPYDGMERLYIDLTDADYAKLPESLRTEGQGSNGLRNRAAYGWKDKDGTVYYERGVPGTPGYQGRFSGKVDTSKYHFVDELYPKTENPDLVTRKNGGFTKYQKGGSKSKGKEYKTPTGQSIYLDPDFKTYARYKDENGNVIPTTELQKFSMIYDPQANTWDSTHSETPLQISERRLTTEDRVNKWLGNPMDKAVKVAEGLSEAGEDPIDNIRHPLAGMYAAQAIAKKTGNIPYISPALGWLGSNAMGIGHELGTIMQDGRPWKEKGQEAFEDLLNNNAGATMSLMPIPDAAKEEALFQMSFNNKLPDGIVHPEGRDFYFKKDGGLTKFVNGGPKEKGWREYKTATGESLYLDPRFKNQRYYVNEKGDHVTPDQNMSLFDVKDNIWESGTSLPPLEVSPRYKYVQRPGALGAMETVRIDLDNGSQKTISPDVMATKREMDAFANSFNPAGLALQGVSNMAQGDIVEGALQTALSIPVVGQVLGKAVTAPLKFAGKEIAQTYGPALSEVGRLATTKTPLKNTWKLNPYRNRLDQYNRVVGRDAIDNALESRVIRSGSGEGLSQRPTAYPSFTNGLPNQTYIDQVINMGETPYIISTNRPMGVSTLGRHGKGTTYFPIGEDYVHGSRQYLSSFPIEETQLYNAQPHWLKGYQKVWNNPTTDLDFSKLHVYNETLPDGRIVRMLGNTSGKPIGEDISSGGAFNEGVYTLTNFPDYVIKAENAALMETMIPGYKGFNISEMQSGLNSPNISKVIKSHPSNDISYQLMRRLSGTPTPDVDPKTLMNISDDAYRQLWRDAKHVRDNNLAIDFAGDNIMYDNATGTFKLLDISPTIEGSEWNSITGGGLEPGMSKGLSAQFLQDALAEKLRLSYARSLKSNGSSPGIRSVLNDQFEKQTVPRIKKIFTDEGPYKEGGSVLKSFIMSQLQTNR